MTIKYDLHSHTTNSDGFYSTKELILKAKSKGLHGIAITDHDTVGAYEEAFEIGKKEDIIIIPGVELSTDIGENEIHILGYFFDVNNSELIEYLKYFRKERYKRACKIIDKLKNLGFDLSIDEIKLPKKNTAIGRPHIAKLLHDKGYIKNYLEAFYNYIGNGCPAFEKKVHFSPQSAFKLINNAGGLSFIAHPGKMSETLLKELIDAGVDGIEVYHPSHSAQRTKFYQGIVNEFFLLGSGGSDFHGGKRDDLKNFGRYYVTEDVLDKIKRVSNRIIL